MARPDEINPNHPVTQEISDHWHKIAAILLWKLSGKDARASVKLTPEDIGQLPPDLVIVVHAHKNDMDIKLLPAAEAEELAREAGGMPA